MSFLVYSSFHKNLFLLLVAKNICKKIFVKIVVKFYYTTTFLFISTPLSKSIFVIEACKQLSTAGNCGLLCTSLLHINGIICCMSIGI